jgi:hypothetical protein
VLAQLAAAVRSCRAPQVAPQRPAAQTCPAAQAREVIPVVHAPQLPPSVLRFTSQPLAGSPSQSAKPVVHAPMRHAPLAHAAAALAKAQRRPHPPQFAVSLPSTAVSQPLTALRSQSAKPRLQPPTTHCPAAQALTLALVSAQRLPQAPQFAGSTRVFAQSPAQFVVPAPQVAPHAPPAHTWPATHARLCPGCEHAPQLPPSVLRFTSQPLLGSPSQSAKPVPQLPIAQVPLAQVADALA